MVLRRRIIVRRVGVTLLQPPRRIIIGHRVQQRLLLLRRHWIRAGHHRLPRHRLVLHRLSSALVGILIPPGVWRSRF
jgi:hypothetical protein